MKFKHQFDENYGGTTGEVNLLPSMTVPDQAMSIQEIMRRYASGLPLGGERVPIYEGEESEHPDMTGWDYAEKQEYFEEKRDELMELHKRIAQQKEEARLKEESDRLEYEAFKASKKAVEPPESKPVQKDGGQ